MREKRTDRGRVTSISPTPQGGLRIQAVLTRAGVFDYGDHKEFRDPKEVGSQASIATIEDAPVTIGHPGLVSADNWRAFAVGHGRGATFDGELVHATVIVQDKTALDQIKADGENKLREISMGYEVDIDPTAGEYQGKRYDAIQRNIVYNHIALGPENWGRAGRDVRLMMDSLDAPQPPPVEPWLSANVFDAAAIETTVSTNHSSAHYTDNMTIRNDAPAAVPTAPVEPAPAAPRVVEDAGIQLATSVLKDQIKKLAPSFNVDGKSLAELFALAEFAKSIPAPVAPTPVVEAPPAPAALDLAQGLQGRADQATAPTEDPQIAFYKSL